MKSALTIYEFHSTLEGVLNWVLKREVRYVSETSNNKYLAGFNGSSVGRRAAFKYFLICGTGATHSKIITKPCIILHSQVRGLNFESEITW